MSGDLQSETSALGQATQHTKYDKHGHVLQTVRANGVVTDYTYDLRQRLTSVSVAGQTTTYAYYPTGLLKRVTQPDGSFVENSYDDAHRLIATSDNLGNRIAYTLDNAGNRTKEEVSDATGTLTQRLARIIDPLGRVQQTTVGATAVASGGTADTFAANVSLLLHMLHMDGPDASSLCVDASGKGKTPSSVATPLIIDGSNAKFGTGAANFTGGYLWYPPSPDFDMGAGDFTVEGWFKFNGASVGSRALLYGHAEASGANASFTISKDTSERLAMQIVTNTGTFGFTGSSKVLPNVWYHLALVRSGNTLTLYRDGAVYVSGSVSGSIPPRTSRFGVGVIGEYLYAYGGMYGSRMMGWIDDFRITKGVARYTGPFTPPAAPFADGGQ